MSDQPTNSQVDLVSAALVECQGELKAAEFDSNNPFFNSKYASLGSVIEASRPSLFKNGLAILQVPTIANREVTVTTEIIHKSGQKLPGGSMTLSLPPLDEQPNDDDPEWKKKKRQSDAQLSGSIITYLKRYAWASVLGIYADFDDDGNSAPQGAVARQAPKPAQTANQPAKPLPIATQARRTWVINALKATPDGNARKAWTDYVEAQGWITPQQLLEDWPLDKVPVNGDGLLELIKRFDEFCQTARGAA